MIKIAFAGEKGAFAEIAARQYFGMAGVEYLAVPDFEDVFGAVKRKSCDFGIVPIENSLAGSIHRNYDLLLESRLRIAAETYLRVNHCLVGKRGAGVRSIRRVLSHPMALAQCARFFKRRPNIELVPSANTALAAKMVAEDPRRDTAAIASASAAAKYHLEVIKPNIEDSPNNVTRFLVISRESDSDKINKPASLSGVPRKTSIVFSVKNIPGGLFKALGVFALRDIDLFKIESRPFHGKGFEYLFYLDCRGDVRDVELKNAISHLKEIAVFYRMLGSYDIIPSTPAPLGIS